MFKYPKVSKDQTRRYARGEHVMNKAEGAVMRRIQSETGLSEEEVRTHKKYRKMLSDAQNATKDSYVQRRKMLLDAGMGAKTPLEIKWDWGSPKTMFMQKACEILDGDKEAAARLYKRYAGGLIDDRRPTAFYYRHFDRYQPCIDIMKAIDKTDGMFVFSQLRDEVGFMYESSLTMFSLVYTPQ